MFVSQLQIRTSVLAIARKGGDSGYAKLSHLSSRASADRQRDALYRGGDDRGRAGGRGRTPPVTRKVQNL